MKLLKDAFTSILYLLFCVQCEARSQGVLLQEDESPELSKSYFNVQSQQLKSLYNFIVISKDVLKNHNKN